MDKVFFLSILYWVVVVVKNNNGQETFEREELKKLNAFGKLVMALWLFMIFFYIIKALSSLGWI